jgi:hypothetical protein
MVAVSVTVLVALFSFLLSVPQQISCQASFQPSEPQKQEKQ